MRAVLSQLSDVQVYAEIQARFSKKYKSNNRHMVGRFTRDFREHELDCQILVTVPQCLQLLLLSAENVAWTMRIKHCILDEVGVGACTCTRVPECVCNSGTVCVCASASVTAGVCIHRELITSQALYVPCRRGGGLLFARKQ